ncbi:metal-dependent hydrolase family protein [Acetonema longum]|uniref:Parathion hydrolase n=1 Tax=Acetonema longum DSM 6540 TaxID=1009370 RepID=F7NF16_9FIRM|nr:amidohydrolase family protein [Acetonema longum]EGO65577.1 parathion hydrolase [Acetonema longum DSM 6540]
MKKVAFKGGLLIDGTGAPAIANSLVLVEEKRITYAGADKAISSDYEIVDIAGKTIMPGLIDAHLHFSGNLTDNDSEWVTEDNLQKAVVAVQQSRECLETGLTTVGEISRFGIHIRNMVEAGVMKGPRVVASGLGFCATCSHGDSHKVSIEQNKAAHPWGECVDSPWDLRKAVRRRLRENPDAIKIWATGGGIWRWETAMDQHYTMEEVQAVVDECNMRHIPVWSHCFGSALNSAKAGVSLIIHGQSLDDETLDIMAEKNIGFCPTISFMPAWFKTFPPVYDPALHDKYSGETVTEKELNRIYENLRKANEKGILLTIGSDSFNSQMTPYGDTAVGELYAFVEKAGISEMDAITAATINGAKVLLVDHITGSLEAGKSADLLVINGNPLENIRAIAVNNMEIIMKEGDFIKRNA